MFLFSTCQIGAEHTLKSELRKLHPSFRPSFSRPGFLTFKVTDPAILPETLPQEASNLVSQSVFTRSAACSLGKIETENLDQVAEEAWKIADEQHYFVNRVHVFQRDPAVPGQHGFEPGATPLTLELHEKIVQKGTKPKFFGFGASDPTHPALLGELVLDIVQVDPALFFVGVHRVSEDVPIHVYYPGGVIPLKLPEEAVSRAWLKFEEGLRWSGLPIGRESICMDIGAAPGGASQVLLARGAQVIGIDPGEMDPTVLNHSNFTHIRGRINQTKRILYKNVRWLIADMNVAPTYTLEVIGELTARKDIKLKGLLFTLKLPHWDLAEKLPEYARRIKRFGMKKILFKQLTFNRKEIMVCALPR